jgi:hypothetical protein
VSGITTLQSGFPLNISNSDFSSLTCYAFFFYGCPDNGQQVASIVKFDPRQVQTLTNYRNLPHTGNFYFAPADFCIPRLNVPSICPQLPFGQFGNNARNSLHGPGINVTNIALLKEIHITEQRYFELRLETQNTFNHVSFSSPNTNIASANFGRITSDSVGNGTGQGPRLVQLGAKFYF